jgi:hypothetical protein
MRTQSPIKVHQSPLLVQPENVLKRETPSKVSHRQSPNFVQRDIGKLFCVIFGRRNRTL